MTVKVGKPTAILPLPLILKDNLCLLRLYKFEENSPRLGSLQALPKSGMLVGTCFIIP